MPARRGINGTWPFDNANNIPEETFISMTLIYRLRWIPSYLGDRSRAHVTSISFDQSIAPRSLAFWYRRKRRRVLQSASDYTIPRLSGISYQTRDLFEYPQEWTRGLHKFPKLSIFIYINIYIPLFLFHYFYFFQDLELRLLLRGKRRICVE